MSSNFNNAKIINVYYNKGDRKPYDVNGKPIAYIGEEFIGANEATEIRFFFGEELDSASAIIVAKRANNDTRLDPLELVGTGVNAYFKIRLNAWYAEYKGKMTIIFKVYNGTVTYDDPENPTQITATTGQIIVSDIFNLEVAYAPNASSLVPPFETEDYDDWFFTLSTKLDKAQSITVVGALPTLTGDVYDDRYFYVENEGVGRLYYINGSTAIEVVFQVGTLRLTPTGNGDITADTGKLSWNQPNGTAQLGLYNDVNIGIGEDVMYYGKASATITKGQVIQFGGYQGDHILMKPAVPAEINANPKLILGIAKQAITSGDFGYVAHFGKIEGYDSGAFAVGSLLWFNSSSGSNGLLTATQPTAPNAKILMAALIKAETSGAANNGVLQVRITIEPKLSELKDVLLTNPQEEDVLLFDQNAGYWYNSPALQNAMSDIATLQSDVNIAESDIDSLESRMTTAEGDIDDIEDGTTIVPKALADQNNDVIDTTYLKIASASATYIPLSQKGQANGVVPLGSNGKVPSIYLSGEQDDLAEFANLASFPAVGETDILYVAFDTNKLYRWSGSAYVVISETLAIGTTNTTAFAGDRGLALETLTDNIVDGDQALALKNQVIRNTVVGTSPLVVNSIASTTANLTEFQVNGTKVLEVTPAGNLLKNGNLFLHNTGSGATGVGDRANRFGGTSATAVGHLALFTASSTGNTAVGHASLFDATGGGNTVIGESAGRSIITGANNTFVGNSSGYQGSQLVNAVNSTAIGNGSFTDASNQMVFGNASVTQFKFDRNTGAEALLPRLTASSSSIHKITRTSAVTTEVRTPFTIRHLTSGNMADGFGSSLTFAIQDDANTENLIGSIQGVRTGADNSGSLFFTTYNAGTETTKMTILPDGKVGIGTASPAGILSVLGAGARINANGANGSGVNNALRLGGGDLRTLNDATQLILSQNPSSSWYSGAIRLTVTESSPAFLNPRMDFLLQNNATFLEADMVSRMTILSTGNVGIGTASPATKLDVNGVINTNNNISWANGNADINGQDTNLKFRTYTGSALTEKVRILGNGNVGIGTTTPATNLSLITESDTQSFQIRRNASSGVALIGFRINTTDNTSNFAEIRGVRTNRATSTDTDIQFFTRSSDSLSEKMRIRDDGLVGINETSPTAQLQVKSGATTRVPLIVDTLASHTANLQEWRVNNVIQMRVDASFGIYGTALRNIANGSNSAVVVDTTGTTISRNIADTNPALIVNLANASATGNIQVWQKAGTAKAWITNAGGAYFDSYIFTSTGISNNADTNNALINTPSTGAIITRNINDANSALKVNLAHASSTGNILELQNAGTNQASVAKDGIANFTGTPSNAQTGDYTLVLADKGKVLRVNSSSNRTVTIPLNSSVAFPTDTEIAILRYGTGTVSISPTSGVTLNSKNSETKISGQYGSVALKKIGENEWVLVGSLEA